MSVIVNKGLVLIISSPSGAGKTTICKKLINEVENLNYQFQLLHVKKKR